VQARQEKLDIIHIRRHFIRIVMTQVNRLYRKYLNQQCTSYSRRRLK